MKLVTKQDGFERFSENCDGGLDKNTNEEADRLQNKQNNKSLVLGMIGKCSKVSNSIYEENDLFLLNTDIGNTKNANELEMDEKFGASDNVDGSKSPDKSCAELPIPGIFIMEDPKVLDLSITSDFTVKHNEMKNGDVASFERPSSFRSLTLELERNLKISPNVPDSSVWNNSCNRRLIRQTTIDGIKDYFNTLDRLERNSVSFIAKNRRASLPLPPNISRSKNYDTEKETSHKVTINKVKPKLIQFLS